MSWHVELSKISLQEKQTVFARDLGGLVEGLV